MYNEILNVQMNGILPKMVGGRGGGKLEHYKRTPNKHPGHRYHKLEMDVHMTLRGFKPSPSGTGGKLA